MALSIVSAPTAEPLTTAEAKAHLRVDVSTDDTLIDTLVAAARQYVENYTRRALLEQTWDLKLDQFPTGPILLPLPPVTAVTSITYLDVAGATQTWASSQYLTDLPTGPIAGPARITPAYGLFYPPTYGVMNSVTVRFVCGYGTASTSIPQILLACIKEHVRANYGRGAEDRKEIMDWIDAQLIAYVAFAPEMEFC